MEVVMTGIQLSSHVAFFLPTQRHVAFPLTKLDRSYNLDLSEITGKVHQHVCQEKKYNGLSEKRGKVRCAFWSFTLKNNGYVERSFYFFLFYSIILIVFLRKKIQKYNKRKNVTYFRLRLICEFTQKQVRKVVNI